MRLLQLFEGMSIFEAAKDRYAKQLQNLVSYANALGVGEKYQEFLDQQIMWAINTLRKDDKITWYLRYVKIHVLARLMVDAAVAGERDEMTPELQQIIAALDKAFAKVSRQMSEKSGIPADEMGFYGNQVTSPDFKRRMEHFMSLGLPAIEGYVMAWQKPEEIWQDWNPIERDWQEKAAQTIDIDRESTTTLIKYPDGSEWVNTYLQACDLEAKAMGHCGNAASNDADDEVLSYRTIEKTPKGEKWKPRLTFIYNTRTGLLGETKGRNNNKPDSKYHSVIIDLLKLPMIKGIRGGGYKPENNFSMDDLPDEVAEKLIEQKPALASLEYDYKKRGMTRELLTRMEALVDSAGLDMPEYDEAKNEFLIDTGEKDIYDFLKDVGGDQGKWVASIMSGDEYLDMYGDYPPREAFNELKPDVVKQVGEYLIREHGDDIEQWKEDNDRNFDPADDDDVWDFVEEYEIDDIKEPMSRAMEDAARYGAEKEMYEAVKSWLNDIGSELIDGAYVPFEHDTAVKIHVPPGDMIKAVSDHIDDIEYHGGWVQAMEISPMESPYHGYQDFDYAELPDLAVEHLSNQGVLS